MKLSRFCYGWRKEGKGLVVCFLGLVLRTQTFVFTGKRSRDRRQLYDGSTSDLSMMTRMIKLWWSGGDLKGRPRLLSVSHQRNPAQFGLLFLKVDLLYITVTENESTIKHARMA
jgi:hypothetical protein